MPEEETLKSLILNSKGHRSYEDLGRESGEEMSDSTWAKYGSPTRPLLGMPRWDSIKTIARVLRVPERRVTFACLRELGYEVDDSYGMSPLLTRLRDVSQGGVHLNDTQIRLVIELVAELDRTQVALEAAGSGKTNVRALRVARKSTGNEDRGKRGSTKQT